MDTEYWYTRLQRGPSSLFHLLYFPFDVLFSRPCRYSSESAPFWSIRSSRNATFGRRRRNSVHRWNLDKTSFLSNIRGCESWFLYFICVCVRFHIRRIVWVSFRFLYFAVISQESKSAILRVQAITHLDDEVFDFIYNLHGCKFDHVCFHFCVVFLVFYFNHNFYE